MEVNYLDLFGDGYMGSMQWQLGREMGTIPAFASRTQENQENLGRDGLGIRFSQWETNDHDVQSLVLALSNEPKIEGASLPFHPKSLLQFSVISRY